MLPTPACENGLLYGAPLKEPVCAGMAHSDPSKALPGRAKGELPELWLARGGPQGTPRPWGPNSPCGKGAKPCAEKVLGEGGGSAVGLSPDPKGDLLLRLLKPLPELP